MQYPGNLDELAPWLRISFTYIIAVKMLWDLNSWKLNINSFKQWGIILPHNKRCREASDIIYQLKDIIWNSVFSPIILLRNPNRFSCLLDHKVAAAVPDTTCRHKNTQQKKISFPCNNFLWTKVFPKASQQVSPSYLIGHNWDTMIGLLRSE